MKIAADIKDSDIRKLLAERKGQEYLDGGQLPSNQEEALYLPKMAAGGYSAPAGLYASTGDNYDLKAHKKKPNTYQKLRDYGTTGMKGALTGLGVLGASNAMRGRFGSPSGPLEAMRAAKQARRAATIGGSAAIIDRAYRHDELSKQAMVNANPSTPFTSPRQELSTGQETGKFESRVIHDYGKAPKTVQIGRKFRIP
jgi:hypothetical protein